MSRVFLGLVDPLEKAKSQQQPSPPNMQPELSARGLCYSIAPQEVRISAQALTLAAATASSAKRTYWGNSWGNVGTR